MEKIDQNCNAAEYFLNRHTARIEQRKKGLSIAHDFLMEKMSLLKTTLHLFNKTYGFLQCKFNGYLKSKIKKIKQRMADLKGRCRSVLQEIERLEHRTLLPFAG